MYNRYIPQPDGSYRRSRMPEPHPATPQHAPVQKVPCPEPEPAPESPRPVDSQKRRPCPQRRQYRAAPPHNQEHAADSSVSGFLKRLLPKDFDTGDLLIVLLLLLMAGDSKDDQNNALLTLALYFFM